MGSIDEDEGSWRDEGRGEDVRGEDVCGEGRGDEDCLRLVDDEGRSRDRGGLGNLREVVDVGCVPGTIDVDLLRLLWLRGRQRRRGRELLQGRGLWGLRSGATCSANLYRLDHNVAFH
ncbi:hydantoinase B/oxoprolinase [Colletotrichum asianum]